ncbi:MAG: hypothetical protein WCY19_08665 [Candidatus Gastranaerophilaceae bacterium]
MMKNLITNFFLVFILLLSVFTLTACNKPKTIILFNKEPITKETLLRNSTEFIAGKRIYYIFITQKPLETGMIRIRVLKREEKVNYETSKIVFSNDFRLSKDQIYYYNDYIVMNEAGTYCMEAYAKNNMERPLAIADFRVKR